MKPLIIIEHVYHRLQIFNMNETALFWKKMPSHAYKMTDGTKSSCKHSGFKAQKDRLTLLLCNNAAGFMHKSGLIYKSFNPWTRKNTAYICGTQWTNLDHQNPCIQLVPSELYLSSQELPPKSAYGFQRVANHRQYWTTTPSFDCLNLSV